MAVRFHERHALETILDLIHDQCVSLGWGDAAVTGSQTVNFGADPFTYQKALPEVFGTPIKANTVMVSFGVASEDADYEMGAWITDQSGNYGLHVVEIPVFVDIFSSQAPISDSIASDIKQLLARDFRFITLKDYTSDSNGVDTQEQIEFENVMGPEEPPAAGTSTDFRRNWRMVKAMCCLYWNPQVLS